MVEHPTLKVADPQYEARVHAGNVTTVTVVPEFWKKPKSTPAYSRDVGGFQAT